jgi:mycoredoxin
LLKLGRLKTESDLFSTKNQGLAWILPWLPVPLRIITVLASSSGRCPVSGALYPVGLADFKKASLGSPWTFLCKLKEKSFFATVSSQFGEKQEHKIGRDNMTQTSIVMYGTKWCGDCIRSKRVLEKLGIPYKYIDIEGDQEAVAYVLTVNKGHRAVPTITFPDGSVLVEPSDPELEEKLKGKAVQV